MLGLEDDLEGELIPTTKSRFIQEIPENLIDNFTDSNQNFTSNNSFNLTI